VKVIRADLGAHPREVFAEWEDHPFAAASIGQVHRAVTRGGEHVAVKVQYPGIDKAIENDLKSLSVLEATIAPMGRRYQSKEVLAEIKSVFLAEVDYGKEAEAADQFRRVHQGDDDIVIPRILHSLSTKRVLTMELMGGVDFGEFCARSPQSERNAAGESLARFMFRALWRHGLLYADPHPGNYRFLGGAKVVFLDFGCHRLIPAPLVEGMKRYVIALQNGDLDEFYRACVDVLGYDPSDPESWILYTEYTKLVLQPLVVDARFQYTKEFARQSVAFLVRGGKKLVFKPDAVLPNLPAPVRMPSDFTFVNRLQWGFGSILAGLGAEANWRRLVEPWLRGPVTPIPPG
jgi:predicted unusual protein kinase regulating ubiquinone biosynthesis (AarF/ABC1/UbiB family)